MSKGYLVEHKRTGSPYWVKASPQKVRQTQLTVCGLEPGWRYQFRVSAENEIGLSDPSPLSEPLTIFVHRSAAIAPYFVTELHDVAVLENERVKHTINIIIKVLSFKLNNDQNPLIFVLGGIQCNFRGCSYSKNLLVQRWFRNI